MNIPSIGSCGVIAMISLAAGCSSPAENSVGQIPQRYDAVPAKIDTPRDLYVANHEISTIFLYKNDGFTPDGAIKTGVSGPWGLGLDSAGNLYVANANGANVSEYAPGATTPLFTYSKGMISPRSVSIDLNGDVFEADQGDQISEFAQMKNRPIQSCPVSAPFAAATDSAGDVFVDYNVSAHSGGRIAEFKGGLAGCSPTELGVHVSKAAGLVLDRDNNILVADYNGGRIDVVPPPYTTIGRHLKAGGSPFFISIDSSNKRVFASVGGLYSSKVVILDYATGSIERKLQGSRRLESSFGVVDAPNPDL